MSLRNRKAYHDQTIFFITTTCKEWKRLLSIGSNTQTVLNSLQFCSDKYQASILGYVIMPNHIHLLMHFPKGIERTNFMRDFKKFTSTKIRQEVEAIKPKMLEELLYVNENQKFKVWEDRYDEVYIVSKKIFEIKLKYIHANPLQEHWKLSTAPEEYPFSSASYYLAGREGPLAVKHYLEFF
jgi:putative transposase